jgi:lysophospholipase L1-like esterase
MTQVFILGDSVAYGVGAAQAGWADLLKQWLFKQMYSEGGTGETYELFNFAYPGGGIEFVLETQLKQMDAYRRDDKIIAVACTGGNNAKAVGDPHSFVSSPEEYKQLVTTLLDRLQQQADAVIALPSLVVVDETKVCPKINPFTGKKSFFTNERIAQFNRMFQELCQAQDVSFVYTSPEGWAETCLYTDGLHPNQVGHQRLYDQIQPLVQQQL